MFVYTVLLEYRVERTIEIFSDNPMTDEILTIVAKENDTKIDGPMPEHIAHLRKILGQSECVVRDIRREEISIPSSGERQ